jgi:hypothetical protein
MKVTLPYQIVLLCRTEIEKTPLVVLPHEVEVLKSLHGEDAIREIDSELPNGVTDSTFDTAEEYSRLEQYYRGNENNQRPVFNALGSLADFENSLSAVEVKPKAPKAKAPKAAEAE